MEFRSGLRFVTLTSIIIFLDACGGGGGHSDKNGGGNNTDQTCVWDLSKWDGCKLAP